MGAGGGFLASHDSDAFLLLLHLHHVPAHRPKLERLGDNLARLATISLGCTPTEKSEQPR